MQKEIVGALVGGVATVLAAIIGLANLRRKKTPEDETTQPGQTSSAVSVSGVAIAVSGRSNQVSITNKPERTRSDLRLVEVDFDDSQERFPKLDIKVRNAGDEPAYITGAEFELLDVFVPKEFSVINYSMQSEIGNSTFSLRVLRAA